MYTFVNYKTCSNAKRQKIGENIWGNSFPLRYIPMEIDNSDFSDANASALVAAMVVDDVEEMMEELVEKFEDFNIEE